MSEETPPAPQPAAVRFDPVALERLRELDPDGRHGVMQRVMTAFETSLARMLVQLQAERSGGNAAVVSSVAHTLKSSSASVGATVLSQACADIERRLRTGEPGSLDEDVERLLRAGEDALAAVRAMLRP
jgi:hypothetical protein